MNPAEATFVAHARSLTALYGPGPWPNDGYPLPDEPPPRQNGEFLLPSVVFDGVSTHHFGTGSPSTRALADAIVSRLDDPARLPEMLAEIRAVQVADNLVQELRSRNIDREKLRNTARFVCEHATQRESAKLGIVLLGIGGDARDRELLQLLGTLDEFALFAVVALMNTQPDRQRAVFELAQRLTGWGRIHAVERLAGCPDPDIRAWLLRTGFRNGVMNEYLAHLAATTGGLYQELLADHVDDELLDGAADILNALATGGPAEDMHDYDDAVPVMHRFAELLDHAQTTLGRLDAALTLQRWIQHSGIDWPDDEPARLHNRYTTLLAQQRWRDLVTCVLADPVEPGRSQKPAEPRYRFNLALSCAGRLGMDVLELALARLGNDRYNPYIWQWAMQHADATAIEQVVDLAEQLLAHAELASGPSQSLGLGRDHDADRALEVVVSKLGDHPGLGVALLPIALANRVVRCRRAALTVLDTWQPQDRPPEAISWVRTAAEREPNPELRQTMLAFLHTHTQ